MERTPHRPTRKLRIGAYTLEIEQAPPRAGFRAIARLIRILGPALAGLVSAGGVRVEGEVVPWATIVEGGQAWKVVDHLLTRAGSIDPDEVLMLIDDLVVGRCWATVEGAQGGAALEVTTAEHLDEILPSPFAMFGVLRTALALNMGPILPGHGTSADGSGAATPTGPAATP